MYRVCCIRPGYWQTGSLKLCSLKPSSLKPGSLKPGVIRAGADLLRSCEQQKVVKSPVYRFAIAILIALCAVRIYADEHSVPESSAPELLVAAHPASVHLPTEHLPTEHSPTEHLPTGRYTGEYVKSDRPVSATRMPELLSLIHI